MFFSSRKGNSTFFKSRKRISNKSTLEGSYGIPNALAFANGDIKIFEDLVFNKALIKRFNFPNSFSIFNCTEISRALSLTLLISSSPFTLIISSKRSSISGKLKHLEALPAFFEACKFSKNARGL